MKFSKAGYSLAEAAIVITALSLCVGLLVYGIAYPEWNKMMNHARADKVHRQHKAVMNAYEEMCTVDAPFWTIVESLCLTDNDGRKICGYLQIPNEYNWCHKDWPFNVGGGDTQQDQGFLISRGYLDERQVIDINSWTVKTTTNPQQHYLAREISFVRAKGSNSQPHLDFNRDGVLDKFLWAWGATRGALDPGVCAAYNDRYTDFGYRTFDLANIPATEDWVNGKITSLCTSFPWSHAAPFVMYMFKSGATPLR